MADEAQTPIGNVTAGIEAGTPVLMLTEVSELETAGSYVAALRQFEASHGVPFERISATEQQMFIFTRLRELTQIMRTSPTWNERLGNAGVTAPIDTWEDWTRIPITTRSDLYDLYMNTKRGLVIPWEAGGHRPVASGGSTGRPIQTIYRIPEVEVVGKEAGAFWERNVLVGSGGIANVLDTRNGWDSHSLIGEIFRNVGGQNYFPLGEVTRGDIAYQWLSQGATSIVGLPSEILHIAQLLKADGRVLPEITRVIYGGEFMDHLVLERIREAFPNAEPCSIYSSTQALHMAVEIDGQLRVTPWINYIEVTDDEGRPVTPGEFGHITVTRLMGYGDQPLRLDLQDEGALLLPSPDDPIQLPILQLRGRAGDVVRLFSYDLQVGELLENLHVALKGVLTENIMGQIRQRQLVLDDSGVHLNLVVNDPDAITQLSQEEQINLWMQAILASLSFFSASRGRDVLDELTQGTVLEVNFVGESALIKSGQKTHPFVNGRAER